MMKAIYLPYTFSKSTYYEFKQNSLKFQLFIPSLP